MSELFEFLGRHWVLSGAFGLTLVLFILNELKQRSGGARINPQQAVEMMNHQDAVMIDVRHAESFRDGHIVNAKNFPSSDLDNKVKSLDRFKSKALIIICDQGTQSPKVANKLKDSGFEQIYYVSGGMTSWKAENLPLTKKD